MRWIYRKISINGKAKDVPDDKRHLVEDFRKKSDRLVKHFTECESLDEDLELYEWWKTGQQYYFLKFIRVLFNIF